MTAPWQMTRAEFADATTTRVDRVPSPTFDEFIRELGYSAADLPTDTDTARLIGGSITERTRAGRGKLKALDAKHRLQADLLARYEAAKQRGDIRLIDTPRPIVRGHEPDEAYLRCQHRRAVIVALNKGQPIPARVLAEYPNLQA